MSDLRRLPMLAVAGSLLAACSEAPAQAPAAETATPVSFVEVRPQDSIIENELPGRVSPTRLAEVRPRVAGIVVERIFQQGSSVKAGDVLYRIDPVPFQVQVESAQAALQRAEAVQLRARQTSQRQTELLDRRVTSAAQQEDALAALAQADADVAAARANLTAAELDLQYSEVRAPIDGTIGRAMVTEGALVSSAESLATIQRFDPVYVDFTQSANELLALRRAAEAGVLETIAPEEVHVRIKLDDGTTYGDTGSLIFAESLVDRSTGQVTLRAEAPNPKGELIPGMYVRVVIDQGIERGALSVPQQAVQIDASGASQLYVVNSYNRAEVRPVEAGRVVGNQVVIAEGLQSGERVVVEGMQRLRPDGLLDPQPWSHAEQGSAQSEAAPSTTQADG